MATLDSSPSHFAGQPWSEWAKNVPSPPYNDSGGERTESHIYEDGDSMKLNIEDSALFGVCPSQDEFYLIECEKCKKVVKPQAFKRHLLTRHANDNDTTRPSVGNTSSNSRSSVKASPAKSRSANLSVPTKASVKEIPQSVNNARKMGELHAQLTKSTKSKRNHTMPVVKVERMNVHKMDMKKVSGQSQLVEDSSPLTNGDSHHVVKARSTPTPPIKEDTSVGSLTSKTPTPPPVFTLAQSTSSTKGLSSKFKSTFTSRPLSPPKSASHGLFLTNTTPSLSMATPTLTTATTTCMTTTMTTTHTDLQVSTTLSFNSVSFAKPYINDEDIKNLQNLEVDDEVHDKDTNLNDFNLNKVKVESRSSDEGYSSSVLSYSDSCLNHRPQTSAVLTGHSTLSLNETKPPVKSSSASNVNLHRNRNPISVDNAPYLKSHLLSGRKSLSKLDTSLSSVSSTSLNSSSSSSLNSGGSSPGDPSKKKYPRLLFGKADKVIPCKDREYDPDKHCGVTGDDGKPCTRSLTCKTHAISRRRKVAGRRKPFDDLLKEHRAAKELLLKQKAEMKQAAAMGLSPTSVLQGGIPTVPESKPSTIKIEKENTSQYSGHADSQIPIFKPVKPNSIHTHRSSLSSLHSFSTPSPREDLKPPEFPERVEDEDECTYLPHHPRPAAMCTYGARFHSNNAGKRCYSFTRRTDMFRVAFISALEKHLNPPPAKKRCLETNLSKDTQGAMNCRDPYDFQSLDAGSIPQVQHFTPVLNQVDNLGSKNKSRSSSGGKHKQKDSGSKSPSSATNSAILNAIGNSAKRRRSGTGATSCAGSALTSGLRTVTSNSTMQTVGAPAVMGNITINSQGSTPLIAIPNVNLSSTTLSHISANLNNTKQPKNSAIIKDIKDIGLVLTGLDGSIVNGQYLNITAAPQPVDDKLLQPHLVGKNNKIVNLDQLKTLPKNLIPVNQLLIDGGVQSGTTVLAPVTLAPISNSSNIVTNVSQSQTTPVLVSQNLKPGIVSSHVTLTSIPNGVISSADKSNPKPQGVVHHKPKSIHPQHSILTNAVIASSNNSQVCGGQIITTQLALKPMNIAKSGATGEMTVQPVSLTFPLTGLRVPGQQHPMQTFYITSTNESQQQHDNIQQLSNSPSVS